MFNLVQFLGLTSLRKFWEFSRDCFAHERMVHISGLWHWLAFSASCSSSAVALRLCSSSFGRCNTVWPSPNMPTWPFSWPSAPQSPTGSSSPSSASGCKTQPWSLSPNSPQLSESLSMHLEPHSPRSTPPLFSSVSGPLAQQAPGAPSILPPIFPLKVDFVKADQSKRGRSCLLIDRNPGQICRPLLQTLLPLPLQSHGWVLSRGGDVVPWRRIRAGHPHHDQVTPTL